MHALVLLLPGLIACGSSEVVPLDADARIAALESVVADQQAALARIDALEATVTAQAVRVAELEAAGAQGDTNTERLDALEVRLADLEDTVEDTVVLSDAALAALNVALDDLVSRVDGHDVVVTAIDGRVSTLESLAATPVEQELLTDLAAYLDIDRSSSTLVVSGANVQIVNGARTTESTNGVGNLILGYGEDAYGYERAGMRAGSHSLVMGMNHAYTGYANLVHGDGGYVTGNHAAVIGTSSGSAGGRRSVIVGGYGGYASGEGSVVVAGQYGVTYGAGAASVSGYGNEVTSDDAASIGGLYGSVTGTGAVSVGGYSPRVTGDYSVTAGGYRVGTSSAYEFATP